jgi:hypothetical protein
MDSKRIINFVLIQALRLHAAKMADELPARLQTVKAGDPMATQSPEVKQ